MITREQALELLEKLVPRTEEGDLEWEQSSKQQGTFFLTLGDGVVSVSANREFFQLAFFNQSGATLGTFRFRGEHLDSGSERMKELYLAARGAALGADDVFRSMLSALNPDATEHSYDLADDGPGESMPFSDDDEPFAIADAADPRGDDTDAEE